MNATAVLILPWHAKRKTIVRLGDKLAQTESPCPATQVSGVTMRILMVTEHVPYPPISGTPLRNYNLLRRIAREHEVWLAAFASGPDEAGGVQQMGTFCQGVETVPAQHFGALGRPADALRYLLMGRPLELRFYASSHLTQKIQHLVSEVDFDVVEIVDSYMALYLETLPKETWAKTLLTYIDVVYSKCDRISRLEPKRARKLRTWLYGRTMRRWEPYYGERFARCITVSESDRRLLLAANPRLRIDVIPNGVDTHLDQPLPDSSPTPALIFAGNMGYRPNIDAMTYFCQEILPLIRREIADVEMWVVGKNPPPEVERLGGNGVHVTGRVEDVRPYYGWSTVCVVPLRAGGGTRLKILEAMALGRPVVSTSIGCEGLEVADGEHLFIADQPEAFADRTVRLLTDAALRESITSRARGLVVSRYDWDVIAKQLMRVYAEVAR